ncbi:MAG: LytTR family DNA-binding domain-containing protein [Alistipes sp.]|jgi:two-component system LytT family response regulator|nr:LytTR family DNA-binding domain-containing protein [Alistipes sp.]
MVRCVAVDDEPLALRQIKEYIARTPSLELVAACRSASQARDVLDREDADLLFVDIDMPDQNGLDFVGSLDGFRFVIFTTAYSEFAIDGFKLNAIDYLLKPFGYDEFLKAVEKAVSLKELIERSRSADEARQEEAAVEDREFLSVRADYRTMLVRISDIVYLESVGEYVRLHIAGSSPIVTLFRLKNMETTLPADSFMRVHRSYIVNLRRITGYAKGRIYFDGEEYVPLGEKYREQFLKYIDK